MYRIKNRTQTNMDPQRQNDAKARSQHRPSIVRFSIPKRHKPGWLQWLDYLETQTDEELLEVTHDHKSFRAMYDRFQQLVYPKTKNLYKLDLSRTELNLLHNDKIRLFWEDPIKNGSREQYDRLHGRHGYSNRVLAGRHRRYLKEFTKKAICIERC